MDANDRLVSFNSTKSFQPCLLWDTCQWVQLLHHGSLSKCCFPKGFSSTSSMLEKQSCFTEITNGKLFTKMKANVKGS